MTQWDWLQGLQVVNHWVSPQDLDLMCHQDNPSGWMDWLGFFAQNKLHWSRSCEATCNGGVPPLTECGFTLGMIPSARSIFTHDPRFCFTLIGWRSPDGIPNILKFLKPIAFVQLLWGGSCVWCLVSVICCFSNLAPWTSMVFFCNATSRHDSSVSILLSLLNQMVPPFRPSRTLKGSTPIA